MFDDIWPISDVGNSFFIDKISIFCKIAFNTCALKITMNSDSFNVFLKFIIGADS